MSFNGSGTFNVNTPGQPVVTGTPISSTAFNAFTADIASGLSNAMTRDGQSPATGNIPFGGFKATGLANGTATTDAATFGQVAARSYVSVNDYPYLAVGNGSTDDYAAIQACIDANPGKVIFLPSKYYKHSAALVIEDDGTYLTGPGGDATTLIGSGTDTDGILFKCSTTATVGDYLNNCGIANMRIMRSTTAATGAGLRLRQCNGFALNNVQILDYPEGYAQEGGQAVNKSGLKVYMSSLYSGAVSGSSLLKYTAAPITGGLYQQVFTSNLTNFTLGGGQAAVVGILLQATDGVNFANGYVSNSDEALVRIKPAYSGKNISVVNFSNIYFDGISQSTGTNNGIEVLDDGFAGASLVNNIVFESSCFIGNLKGKGVYSTHPSIQTFSIDPSSFVNVAGAEVDITGGDTTPDSWIGIPLSWTPVLTFATPGNLSVSYSAQLGSMLRTNDGQTHISWSIATSGFTHTTASGNMQITGVPVGTPSPLLASRAVGTLAYQGVTKAGYTQISPYIAAGSTALEFNASGSAVGLSTVAASDAPTGGTVILRGTLSFPSAELG